MQTVADALANLESSTSSPLLTELGERFSKAGFEISLVGGPVRDAFLGRESPDLDFTTNALPDQILGVLKGWASNTWDVGREFGTIAAIVEGEQVEITTYRADSYDKKTRKPTVEFGKDLESDLIRRDFAVNAMALRLPERVFVDPHGGLQDLIAQKLKTPSDPEISFSDDPLRMMRACRFAAQLSFDIDIDTFQAMMSMANRIEIISQERIRDELIKLLLSDKPRLGLTALVDSGIADYVLPELPALKLEADEHHHHKDVYQHTLTVLEQSMDYEADYQLRGDLISRMAALLHDIGKPATKKLEPGGAVTFYHHDIVGSKLAQKRLRELRFDNETIKAVSLLIELHLRFFGYSDQQWSDSAVRRYVRDAGDQLQRLHILTRSDVTTRNKRKAERLAFAYDDLEQRIKEISEKEELNAMRPDLDGEQIMRILEIPAGPEVGKAYKYLLELRIENGPLGEEEAKKRLLEWWSAR
jgi:poly(A) polymerase